MARRGRCGFRSGGIQVEVVHVVNDVDVCCVCLDEFSSFNEAGPRRGVHISANGDDWGNFSQLLQNFGFADIAGVRISSEPRSASTASGRRDRAYRK